MMVITLLLWPFSTVPSSTVFLLSTPSRSPGITCLWSMAAIIEGNSSIWLSGYCHRLSCLSMRLVWPHLGLREWGSWPGWFLAWFQSGRFRWTLFGTQPLPKIRFSRLIGDIWPQPLLPPTWWDPGWWASWVGHGTLRDSQPASWGGFWLPPELFRSCRIEPSFLAFCTNWSSCSWRFFLPP